MSNSKIFLDTNVLIYQAFEDFDVAKHTIVKAMFQKLHETYHNFYISSQIIREFIAIATNGTIFKSPLDTDQVILKVNEFERNFHIVFDTSESLKILKDLVKQYHIEKYRVHDANIAATVVANQIGYLWTFNKKDFKIFNQVKLLQFEGL